MNEKVLVCAYSELDENDFHEKQIFENITNPKRVTDLDTEEKTLIFKSNSEEYELDLSDIEWYRIVPNDSHLANYVRNDERYDCDWDDEGEQI